MDTSSALSLEMIPAGHCESAPSATGLPGGLPALTASRLRSSQVAGKLPLPTKSKTRPRLRLVPRGEVHLVRPHYAILKRCLDVVVCLVLLPPALGVMAVCAALIWLDNPGPVLFRQFRTGQGGRRFRMYKFRTMRTDAELLKQKYLHLNELTWPDFKIANDPRVTRVGRLLRRTSLDELPQIFNVLRGDMSLVGPRPTSFEASTYALWQMERLEVRPGITGLWQVSGRSEVDFNERSRLDIFYIENQSMQLDLGILARTALAVVSRRGAY